MANKQESSYNSLLDETKIAQVPRLNSMGDRIMFEGEKINADKLILWAAKEIKKKQKNKSKREKYINKGRLNKLCQ